MSFLRYNIFMPAKKVTILNVPFDAITYRETLEAVARAVKDGKKEHLVTVNPEMLVQADSNPDFLNLLKNAAMVLPDGVGILWAASYLNHAKPNNRFLRWLHWAGSLVAVALLPCRCFSILPQRVTGVDLMVQIAERSGKEGWRIFLLGAQEGIAEIAAKNLQSRYPDAQIVGTYSGSPSPAEEEEIASRINTVAPDILFVAYGSPAQEFWIARNLSRFTTVKAAIGVGGAFDFIARKIRRAPRFLRTIGLEWLWRLLMQPKRAKRIYRATIRFPYKVYQQGNF